MANVLSVRDKNGKFIPISAIKGDKGDSYVLTDADKREIAEIVAGIINVSSIAESADFVTEERVLDLIQANMPVNGDEESY